MKKLIASLMIALTTTSLVAGCSKKESGKNVEIDLFNSKTATDVAKQYLSLVKDNKIDEANELCTHELVSKNKEIALGTSKIISYSPDTVIESTGSAYVLFNVVRSSENEAKCDLDNYAIRVGQNGKDYKIEEVKSMNKKQVFVRNNHLRIIGEDGGDSDLIVSLENLPKDIYISENNIMLFKEKVPADSFDHVALGYEGEKIAIATKADNKTFLSIAYIEQSKQTQGEAGNSGGAGTGSNVTNPEGGANSDLESMLEKPVAKKVVALDIFNDIKVKNLIFTQEEAYIIAGFTNSDKVERITAYNVADGNKVDLKLDEIFPKDKYNIIVKDFDKNHITISVYQKDGRNDIRKELLGEYEVDLEQKTLKKAT